MAGNDRIFNLDITQVQAFHKNIGRIAHAYPKAWNAIKPEFGAYQYYSRYLEEGTSRMRARPHILPAVAFAMPKILDDIAIEATDLLWTMILPGLGTHTGVGFGPIQPRGGPPARYIAQITDEQVRKRLERAWRRTLNDTPRRYAVDNAPSKYGFHRRSIRGYSQPPDYSQIRKWQNAAYFHYRTHRTP